MALRFETRLGYWMVLGSGQHFQSCIMAVNNCFQPFGSEQTRNCGKGGVYVGWSVEKVGGRAGVCWVWAGAGVSLWT